MYINYYIF